MDRLPKSPLLVHLFPPLLHEDVATPPRLTINASSLRLKLGDKPPYRLSLFHNLVSPAPGDVLSLSKVECGNLLPVESAPESRPAGRLARRGLDALVHFRSKSNRIYRTQHNLFSESLAEQAQLLTGYNSCGCCIFIAQQTHVAYPWVNSNRIGGTLAFPNRVRTWACG